MPTIPKQLQAILWIAAVEVVGGLATSAERYRRQVKKLEGLIQVKEFQHQLNVPSEVIYCRATAPRGVIQAQCPEEVLRMPIRVA